MRRGIRILSLDGGGMKGLSQLTILAELMARIGDIIRRLQAAGQIAEDAYLPFEDGEGPLPCEFFDFMAGSGTGGINVVLLGRLGMTITEAKAAYVQLAARVFGDSEKSLLSSISERIVGQTVTGLIRGDVHKFDAAQLEEVMKGIIAEHTGDPEARLRLDRSGQFLPNRNGKSCKVFICTKSSVDAAAANPPIFRSYYPRTDREYNCKIWEAVRATMADSLLFDSISIGSPIPQEYIGAGTGWNNPVYRILAEVDNAFNTTRDGSCRVAGILSLGTGTNAPAAMEEAGFLGSIAHWLPTSIRNASYAIRLLPLLNAMSADCEQRNQQMQHLFGPKKFYFRFNVQQGMTELDVEEWQHLPKVEALTTGYLKDYSYELDEAVDVLCKSAGVIDADKISSGLAALEDPDPNVGMDSGLAC